MMIDRFSGEYDWLSNFYPCEVTYKGTTYPSVENAYQAAKVDMAQCGLRELHNLTSCPPGTAKRLGSKFNPNGWQSFKMVVMKDLLGQKFSKPYFAELLLATGEQKIVEGNNWGDTFWGICKGKGTNHLGCMIQEIRADLKRGQIKVEDLRMATRGSSKELRVSLSDGQAFAIPLYDQHVNELAATSDALRHLAFGLDKYAKKGTSNGQ